jgi:thiamine pyrophosphate-dependent acetolactate synthase large subunit-like protein
MQPQQPVRLREVTGGEVVVAALALHDVGVVFGIPGTHNLSVFDALTRYGIRTVATTHEQGAGYAADGFARTSGRPGVAVVTSGPAVYNAATAVAQAYSDSVPMLLVSPGMPRTLPVGGPGSGYLHEAKDQTGAMDRIAAQCIRPVDHQEIADAVSAAYASFADGRPRPICLEVPLDLLEETGDAVLSRAPEPQSGPEADIDLVRAAAGRLESAVRPVFVAGGGARAASAELRALADKLRAPILTTINGKGTVDEQHPLVVGSRLTTPVAMEAAESADVLLLIGTELGNSDLWQRPLRPRGHVVRIDIDERMHDVNVAADTFLHGEAAAVLHQLVDTVDAAAAQDDGAPSWVTDLRTGAIAQAQSAGHRWLPWIEGIEQGMTADAVIAADNAMCVYFGAIGNLTMRQPSSFHFPTGFGTLGFTVPAAIGAALAAPDRQVIGITGDGGLLFTATELAVAAAERLPLVVVVFDNSGYGEIRAEMLERDEKPIAVEAPPRDLVLLATALGAHALRVAAPHELTAEIRHAADRHVPTVLIVNEPPPPEGSPR